MKRHIKVSRRRLVLYGPLTVMHATSGGHAVLRGQTSWRTIDGLLINTRFGHLIVSLRGAA